MKNQNSFSLLIKPASADCNLRCEYCFYIDHLDPNQIKTRMSDNVLKTMIFKFMQTNQPQYAFGWQGGEPTLMGLEFFKKVVNFQQKFGKKGMNVANGLQTNGTLINDEMAVFFRKYNFLLGVSLDGPAYIHDKYRKNIGGKPTHSRVLNGINILRKNNVEFNILTLVTNENVKKPEDLYRYFKENGFNFLQFIPCVEFDQNNHLLPYSISGEDWGNFLNKIFDEWIKNDTKSISIRLFDSILEYIVYRSYNVCQMGDNCCKYFVVEYNGNVYPCDFFVQDDLKLGNILTSKWKDFLNSPIYLKFGTQKATWNNLCQTCPFLELCHGDCQKNRVGTPNISTKTLSVLCKGWKMFYAHSLPELIKLAVKFKTERKIKNKVPILGLKLNRKDLCPCGSGKKYEQCCMYEY